MFSRRAVIALTVTVAIGFAGGFVLRPVIESSPQTVETVSQLPAVPPLSEARGTQYFLAHIDEARQVVAGCRDGSVRGGECATAEEAIVKVDAAERRRRFLGN